MSSGKKIYPPIHADPWSKTALTLSVFDLRLSLHVPHDVFSTQQIDEGTHLLLRNLPSGNPARVLDLGCGYGALGLPVAKKFPNAQVCMVDRDLLAVDWSQRNAQSNSIHNVEVRGSLGYRDLQGTPYDWILCNVPARIGRPFIVEIFRGGIALLRESGVIRVVVIRDLGPILEEIALTEKMGIEKVAEGPRHIVYELKKQMAASQTLLHENDLANLYLRDQVQVQGTDIVLDRPYDLGGDDPVRLKVILPLWCDVLPRESSGHPFRKVFCFRSGYGGLAALVRSRYTQAFLYVQDRDLLGTEFTRRNFKKLGLDGPGFAMIEKSNAWDGLEELSRDESFDLIVGELSPSAGKEVALRELKSISKALGPQSEAFVVCSEKNYKDWIKPEAIISQTLLISRSNYCVLRVKSSRTKR